MCAEAAGQLREPQGGGLSASCLTLHARMRIYMDVYLAYMEELTKKPTMKLRLRFMLQDVVELRERGWRPRRRTMLY